MKKKVTAHLKFTTITLIQKISIAKAVFEKTSFILRAVPTKTDFLFRLSKFKTKKRKYT